MSVFIYGEQEWNFRCLQMNKQGLNLNRFSAFRLALLSPESGSSNREWKRIKINTCPYVAYVDASKCSKSSETVQDFAKGTEALQEPDLTF